VAIEDILSYGDSILFSTELQPNHALVTNKDWWYFVPESGQHISFYTINSLKVIADKYSLRLYTDKRGLHLLTKKSLSYDPFVEKKPGIFDRIRRKTVNIVTPKTNENLESLLRHDFERVKRSK